MSTDELVSHLLMPSAYSHFVNKVELRETHLSYVFLTGEFAYKLKKPLDLGFANFVELESRRKYCHEELRRNQLYSTGIYLDVVPVIQRSANIAVGGTGETIDYLVQMRQFDDSNLAGNLAQVSGLTADVLSELASHVSSFHRSAERSFSGEWGTPDDVLKAAFENIHVLRELDTTQVQKHQLDVIEAWTDAEMQRLHSVFRHRKASGHVRECHGDLHLGNLVYKHGKLVPFDCIEFNPEFYWIDVLNEVAFLVMDLDDHGLEDLGWQFLNTYLEHTGDYCGLEVLRFYCVYRAMVRAKICQLRLNQNPSDSEDKQQLASEWHNYLNMAFEYTRPQQPFLAITHGLSGSGKTYRTRNAAKESGLIRIRSDIERKRVGLSEQDGESGNSVSALGQEIRPSNSAHHRGDYSENARHAVYEYLAKLAQTTLRSGYSTLIDATFLKRQHREMFRRIAVELNIPFYILWFDADLDTLRTRVANRLEHSADASEATVEVLEEQLKELEPLDSLELGNVVDHLPRG